MIESEDNNKDRSGSNNPFFGKHHTDETKKILRKAQIGRIPSVITRLKISKANTGKKRLPETGMKISMALK